MPVRKEKLLCEVHGEYDGFVGLVNGTEVQGDCPHCHEITRMNELEEFYHESCQAAIKALFLRACIPKRFQDKDFNSYAPTCSDAEVVKFALERYAERFTKDVSDKGICLLITGKPGTGKTHLACACANEVLKMGRSALYISLIDYLSDVKSSWKSDKTTEDSVIGRYAKVDLLILDEILTIPLKTGDIGLIFKLINNRYEEQRPTIGISKHKEPYLISKLGEDVVRRLKMGSKRTIQFTWEDYGC